MEDIDIQANSAYRFPPKSGKFLPNVIQPVSRSVLSALSSGPACLLLPGDELVSFLHHSSFIICLTLAPVYVDEWMVNNLHTPVKMRRISGSF